MTALPSPQNVEALRTSFKIVPPQDSKLISLVNLSQARGGENGVDVTLRDDQIRFDEFKLFSNLVAP
jgi:hypothetical protein